VKKVGKYALLKYVSSFDNNNTINLGLILHSPSDCYLKMEVIKNWDSISVMDQSIDILLLKEHVNSINDELGQVVFEYGINLKLMHPDLLNIISKPYINQVQFEIHELVIDNDHDNIFNNLKNNFI
jgi:Protein of unknown function (DUF3037)